MKQGDQIVRIVASWAIVFNGQFLNNRNSLNFGPIFTMEKVMYKI
jgi:hypothetical protein